MKADTIFALASAPGRAGVAVMRLSGPAAGTALAQLAGALPSPRRAARRRFADPRTGEAIDDGLALFFPAPNSFTGEDVAELHVHGSRAVIAALLDALAALPGLRLAEPGEFTRRAFEHGKLDLTAAEGLADLVAAETAAQRRQALRQLEGALGQLYEDWRGRLLRALAHLEAAIDFPEEGLPEGIAEEVRESAAALRGEIARHLADGHRGERLRDGVAVAIIGPPNAGKSSLMNALARRDVAITSATAGTTRDVIEVALDLGGYPIVLADTAGLRDSADSIEEEGVRRARARASAADLRLLVLDATEAVPALAAGLVNRDTIVILNKVDLGVDAVGDGADRLGGGPPLRLSVLTGLGTSELLTRLQSEVAARFAPGDAPLLTRARHREALEACVAALDRFGKQAALELAAEDLRLATQSLGRITGRVDIEDMLDIIFREFCIGK
ncbi:MAG TPA: tRNA uridine-5-carboxymethylaminomethyl(34) synthesis GTPase MnmE [Stellaceae bacterium]|nr:tRNA uridine-5-carboxymethylaminomethyl(34) synthesis GTPase MnmE [Stellaceae bacterium]